MTRRSMALILLCAAMPLVAQTPDRPTVTTPLPPVATASPAEDAADPRAMRLSLDEAIRLAARNNLDVEIQAFTYEATGFVARGAYGIFDPLATAEVLTSQSEQPVVTAISAARSEALVGNLGLEQFLPTGGSVVLGFNNRRNETIGDAFRQLNPSYVSNLELGVAQPLLRNFGVDVNRRGINIARNNLGISQEQFRDVLSRATLAVEQAYLDLIFTRQNLEVQQQSLDLARDQERITQIRIDVGAAAPLDILQPRVAVAMREEAVISAGAQVRDAEDRLRQLMNLEPSDWDRPILPVDGVTYEPVQVDVVRAIEQAWRDRPEIHQARLGIANREIQYNFARNQTLPRLDLRANYNLAGAGGRLFRDGVVVDETGLGDAIGQITAFDFPGWTVGFNVGLPVTNIGARSEERRARLDLEVTRTDVERIRQIIAVEVRGAARDIDTLARQIVATRAAREAAEQNVEAERRRYENGMTTNFQVLQVQQELADARSREILALVNHQKAVAAYHRSVGDLLDERNITVEVPRQFNLPESRLENIRLLNYGDYSRQ
jgi:outer membrane protein